MNKIAARRVLFLIFFISGFTGLIYESLWSHYLKLFLGHAAYAQTLVLMIFMGGMALGAGIIGRVSQNLKNLLAGYAIAEIGIGLLALVFHPLFTKVVGISFEQILPNLGSPWLVEAYKWGMSLLLLLPPSILLGSTFPLMSGAILRRFPGAAGGNLAALYCTNSIGAALGALVASFMLIGLLGLPGTLQFAGFMNLLIGISALLIARDSEWLPAKVGSSTESSQRFGALFLVAAFVTGAASFIYEVSWIRMLSLVLGSSFHAFELMLSAFIAGLAFGSLAIRRHIDRIENPLAIAAVIQIAMGILAVLTLPIYAHSFEWMGALVRSLTRDNQGYMLFNLASHGIAFAVMLPATFMAGMTLPLFTHALIRNGHGEKSIGTVYAANTVGGIVGVIIAMHFALPSIGLKLTLISGALLDIGLGLILLRAAGVSPRKWVGALAFLTIPVVAVQFVVLDSALLASGVYRTGVTQSGQFNTYFYRDGKTASISVLGMNSRASIRTNGKPDAMIEMNPKLEAAPDEITMVMAAAIPLALRPDACRVANIGFGSGLTAHTVLASPNIVELENIEIERAVVDGARVFYPRVERAYNDPRSRINIEDAKSWFARSNRNFDIIISEPSNPWVSGVSSLFSNEFYEQTRNYLADRGLLVQWLNLYEFNTGLAASVITALNSHFEDYTIFLTDDANILIVAIKNGKLPPLSKEVFEMGTMSRELGRVGVHSMDDLVLRHLGTAAMFNPMLKSVGVPKNSDYFPYLELNAPRARFLKEGAVEFPRLGIYPLPLIEMLNHQGAAWEFGRITPTDSVRYARMKEADAIRAALLGEPYQDAKIQKLVEGWQNRLSSCINEEAALSALHEIAIATLAHLNQTGLQKLWNKPGWLRCRSSQIASRLAVYQAVARRDAVAMLKAAESTLQEKSSDDKWRRYVLDVGMLSGRVLSDDKAANRLWEQYGPLLYADEQFTPELVLLVDYRTAK